MHHRKLGRGGSLSLMALAEYLPDIKSPASRVQLWQQLERGSADREQALSFE
jgi:hypothetical protein